MLSRRDFLPLLALPAFGAKGRLRTAICAYSFREALQKKTLTYEDLVPLAVENDVDGLDLTVYWFPSTEASFLLPLKRLAYRNGVEIYSISVRTNMCQPTAELRDKELADVKKWVDVAAALGAGHIRVFGGTVPKTSSEDEAAKWVVDVLARGAAYAGQHGVILGLENHGGITARASRIVDIVKQVNSPWAAVNLDTGNFTSDAYRQIAEILPYAANVQFKRDIRVTEGKLETADWDRLTKMLTEGGYRGYLALEYEEKEDPLVSVPPLLKKLNALARKYSV
ncbi:MAG: sugar phosphate isomerase/epimerase [Bryobacteraceae bacterium]|nr:sugar phosphate isomerase/epimerase [Bryobacteraceae bacterium]